MKAVALTRYLPISHPESLLDVELERPKPGPRDLLVRVEAVSINPVDAQIRAPKPTIEPAPRVLGWDAAGIVEAVGAEVTLFAPGTAVYYAGDVNRPGSNQQLQLVDERIVGRKPKTLDFAEAAALPLTAITAYEALFDRLGFAWERGQTSRTLLIIGAAGGVGSLMIQLARLAGLRVVATASREESRAWALGLGAERVIDHEQDLKRQLDLIGVNEVDAIAVLSHTDRYLPALAGLINPQGRIVAIVPNEGPLDIRPLMQKSVTFSWEYMFTRPAYATPDMIEQHRLLNRVADWMDAGQLRPTLTKRLGPINAASLKEAHALIESGRTIGKISVEGWT